MFDKKRYGLGLNLLLNNVCNKKCSYCYEKNDGSEVMTIEIADKVIEKLRNSDYWIKSVMFFGGEPTISLPLMKHLYEKNKEDVSFKVTTNGYFLEKYDERDYSFMKGFENITVSIEGTEEAFKTLRGGDNLKFLESQMITLSNNNYSVTANISVNGLLYSNIDEFVSRIERLIENNIAIHFYYLKSNDYFSSLEDYTSFILEIRDRNKRIYDMIILNDNNDDYSFEYLCTLENELTVNPLGKFITCAWDKKALGDIDTPIESIVNSWASEVAKNHKKMWSGCENCEVNVGKCSVSCPAFINECMKNDNIELLESLCDRQRVNEYLRRKEFGSDK